MTEPAPHLLAHMANSGNSDIEALTSFFYGNIYHPLWSGQLTTEELWTNLRAVSGAWQGNEYWESVFTNHLRPTAAMTKLDQLRNADHMVILSNHLSHWLRPHLEVPLKKSLIDSV